MAIRAARMPTTFQLQLVRCMVLPSLGDLRLPWDVASHGVDLRLIAKKRADLIPSANYHENVTKKID
jgi:hypothetical protein